MKRSADTAIAPVNRRYLIQNRHELLQDPQVVAFLDNTSHPTYQRLAGLLACANEPALLLELNRATQHTEVLLCALDANGDNMALPAGMLEYVAQHINQTPGVTTLFVVQAALSALACTRLQATLNAPTCTLQCLTFSDCTFADAHAQFPTSANTVQSIDWSDGDGPMVPALPMDRVIPALAGWRALEHVCLISISAPLNFGVIAALLLANAHIHSLYLVADVTPIAPGNPGHMPQQDPALLFDALRDDRITLSNLSFHVTDTHNFNFNDYCLQRVARCLLNNTTLEVLDIPGIRMSTAGPRHQFSANLQVNHSLISLAPLDVFGDLTPAPVRRNQRQRYWFTQEFVLGAAEAFMQLVGLPKDAGTPVAGQLAPTSLERTYCGAVMTLICKSTHDGAVKLRSAGLREAIKIYIRTGDPDRCLDLLKGLVEFHVDLLPADRQQVIECANDHNRLLFLPPGYAQ